MWPPGELLQAHGEITSFRSSGTHFSLVSFPRLQLGLAQTNALTRGPPLHSAWPLSNRGQRSAPWTSVLSVWKVLLSNSIALHERGCDSASWGLAWPGQHGGVGGGTMSPSPTLTARGGWGAHPEPLSHSHCMPQPFTHPCAGTTNMEPLAPSPSEASHGLFGKDLLGIVLKRKSRGG